jgi:hypothetical protein
MTPSEIAYERIRFGKERNAAIRKWFNDNEPLLIREARALKVKVFSGQFYSYLRARIYQRQSKITGGGYVMPRHAIFVHKGVGKGYPIETQGGGMGITRTKKVQKLLDKGYNKAAIGHYLSTAISGKKKNGGRKAKPFFNPIIDRKLPELANTVQKFDADIAAANIFID